MLGHYLSNFLRAVKRDIGYSIINILGLAVGMACCLLILVYIVDELSYDRFHDNSDRIVRLALETKGGDGEWRSRVPTFYLLADMVGGNLSGVDKTVRLASDRALVSAGEQHFTEDNLFLGEAAMFDVFSIPFIRGNSANAFQNPYSVVLTESAARKYFGTQDPIGQILTVDNRYDYEVTGVVEPMPANSHFHFEVLLNLASTRDRYSAEMFESMGAQWIYTYVLMKQPESASSVASRVNTTMAQFIPPDVPVEVRLAVHELKDIHLYSQFESELEPNGNIVYLYLFGAIAVFILIIASVNFMNLATARASVRAREVGVRKLLGAHRSQLVGQFLAESVGMSILAFGIAFVLAILAMPVFDAVTGKALTAGAALRADIVLGLFVIALIVGVLAGSYPAFLLSSFRPAKVLKGSIVSGRSGLAYRLRQALVVFQFGISIAIVLGTLVVFRQLDYMQNTYPGFDRDQILSVALPPSVSVEQVETIKQAFENIPGTQSVSAASHAPPEGLNSWRIRPAGASKDRNELISWIAVDHEYIETLGLEIVEGRPFSKDFPADAQTAIVINEAMARYYGLTEPIGSRFEFDSNQFFDGSASVIGVVKDYQQTSLHDPIRPVFFFLDPYARQVLVKLDAGRMSTAMSDLEDTWKATIPDWPFDYTFLDDQFDALYRSEIQLGNVFRIFALLAIFVACMGLFGLSAYMTERRNREIGVRKVFGASLYGLVGLLTREFLVLVVLAYVIAVPVTWIWLKQWLSEFSYQVDIGAILFIGTGLLALGIAGITVSYQAVRAALMNPVDTLRYD